jgi:hypothetical protein
MSINQITLEQVFSWGRDIAVAGTVITVGWRLRGVWEVIQRFLERITMHMTIVESGMKALLDNHMTHMQETLEKIANAEVSANEQ